MNESYIDTSVYLAYVLGEDKDPKKYPLAKEFFEGLKDRNEQGVLSYLTLMETLSVVRAIKSKEFSKLRAINSETKRVESVIKGAKKDFDELIALTLRVPCLKFMPKTDLDINNLLGSALSIMECMNGNVRFFHRCNNCNTKRDKEFYSGHKCVGTVDIIHALIAKQCKCNKLVTFDQPFQELSNHEKILPLYIDVFPLF